MTQNQTRKPAVRIIVAAHRQYRMPDDPVYLPLLVGAARNETDWDITRDDGGDNISGKNLNYCELTGLYWAWKNMEADYIGLVHYRRYFSNGKWWRKKTDRILTGPEIAGYIGKSDILLPKPRHYLIETNYSQYAHAHHAEDLDITRQIIRSRHPRYLEAFDRVMGKTSGHRCNMMIMKKELLDQYCAWLFDILFSLESVLDISAYSENDRRVYGFVGERLLDVWLETNGLSCAEIPYVFLEKQNRIGKGFRFIARKLKR